MKAPHWRFLLRRMELICDSDEHGTTRISVTKHRKVSCPHADECVYGCLLWFHRLRQIQMRFAIRETDYKPKEKR